MKKFLLGSALVLLTTTAFADNNFYIGGDSSKIENETAKEFTIGYGVNNVKDDRKGLYWAINMEYGYIKLDSEHGYNVSGDLDLGLSPLDNLSVYGIISCLIQNINTEAYGFGYGAGVEYDFSKKISTSLDYKTYNMNYDLGDYDYDKFGLSLKYKF